MSNDALSWAWRAPVKSGAKFVLVALADHGTDHSGEDWTCWPSVERLMARTGFKRTAVETHLKALERDGWLSRSRRKRQDGKLGVYVYVLHRERITEGPKTDLGSVENPVDGLGITPSEAAEPCAESTHGPCAESEEAMRGIRGKPCAESAHEEPLIEPLIEPSLGASAREPGDNSFEAGLAAFPLSGQARTSVAEARAAWAWAVDQVGDAGQLVAAVKRYAAYHAEQPGDYGAPAFHKWLSAENWKIWVKRQPVFEAPAMPVAEVPAALREAVMIRGDAAKVASYLDPCSWDAQTQTLTARTAFAARQLADILRHGVEGLEGLRIHGPGNVVWLGEDAN